MPANRPSRPSFTAPDPEVEAAVKLRTAEINFLFLLWLKRKEWGLHELAEGCEQSLLEYGIKVEWVPPVASEEVASA